jgi:integrase
MATIKAYILPTSKKGKEATIHLRLGGGRDYNVKAPSNKKILPERWDAVKEICKSNEFYKTEKERNDFNKDLADLKAFILQSAEKAEKADINKEWLKTQVDKYFHPQKYEPIEVKHKTLFEFIEQFIIDAPHRIGKRDGTLISPLTVEQYKISFDYLKEFAKHKKKKTFNYSDINIHFYNEYIKFLQSKNMASSTVGAKVKNLKLFLANAPSSGAYDKAEIQKNFKVFKEPADNVALDEVELQKLFDLDFSSQTTKDALKYKELIENDKMYSSRLSTLETVRDGFLLECWTGCRIGELSMITKRNLKPNGMLEYTQPKTGTQVVVPLHPMTKAILERHNYIPPEPISPDKTNRVIKILCRVAGLNGTEKKVITRGGKKETTYFEKWQMVSTHSGRRSFATNCYRMGVPTITIMSITGHKTEAAFLLYIKVGKQEHAEIMAAHWAKIYNTKAQ